jgi:glycosyltransferase involved in cell wall biosynthesis
MKSKPKVSLILATYEMPEHLELVFRSLERQTETDFEIQLCDDGSGEATRKVIESYVNRGTLTIHHFWQENKGFRKCRILNEAIRHSTGELLVFLDADCVPHRYFIQDHWDSRETGRYCAGRRVELGETISKSLSIRDVESGFFDGLSFPLFWDGIKGGTQNTNRVIRLKNSLLRKWFGFEKIDDLKGCNFSVFRTDLFKINGFDEDYEGYGREDTDVELRLQNLGLTIKSLKGLALQYHVWHPRREFTPKNDDRLERVISEKKVKCLNGLEKIAEEK